MPRAPPRSMNALNPDRTPTESRILQFETVRDPAQPRPDPDEIEIPAIRNGARSGATPT